jgi:crotonobetainyl-CoA:carnitine CoA-transferase CaiB-like acyl-CoA transferase
MARPFEGVKVVDLTHVLAGPFCAYQLAILGAETIKVERPGVPDQVRAGGSDPELNARLMGTNYLTQNANKRSIALDLKSDSGRDILIKMIEGADVLLENYRAGAMDALGLGYESLKAINPMLVYCSMTGYGQNGPKADVTAYDTNIQADSGLMSVTGTPEVSPLKVGAPVLDYASGTMAAFAVASALFQRQQTGQGQYIDFSMLDATLVLMGSTATGYLYNGVMTAAPRGNAFSRAGGSAFKTKDGSLLMMGALNSGQHERLWTALDRPDLAAQSSYDALDEINGEAESELTRILADRTAAEWEAFFHDHHVPATRVNTLPEALAQEQVGERKGLFHDLGRIPGCEDLTEVTVPVTGFTFAHGGPSVETAPPTMGAHTDEVLGELGFSSDDIAALRRQGVV